MPLHEDYELPKWDENILGRPTRGVRPTWPFYSECEGESSFFKADYPL